MKNSAFLVTGGAGNLGRSVTEIFLERGARVAVPFHKSDRPDALEPFKERFGDRLLEFGMDLTTDRGAGEAVKRVVEWAGRLDGVAHIMGGFRGGASLAETPVEEWDRMMSLNLRSSFLVARAAIPALQGAGGGALVFVSSRAALAGRTGRGAYAVSKAALITLAETISEEYREQGIRANAILPGVVDTEDNRRAMPDANHARWTAPEKIARVVAFLVSEESAVVNGAAVKTYGIS